MASPRPARLPWWDLGLRFTPRQAVFLLLYMVVILLGLQLLDWVVRRFVEFNPEMVRDWVDGFGALAPIAYTALVAATIIFTPLPSVPVDLAGGLAFGFVLGTIYTMLGSIVGAAVNFYVARRFGRGWLARRLGERAMTQIDDYAVRMGGKFVFVTRLIPLFSFDWISYAAGLTTMRFRVYVINTVLGSLLPVMGIVYAGSNLLANHDRYRLVFGLLVAWSAAPPAIYLVFISIRTLQARRQGRSG